MRDPSATHRSQVSPAAAAAAASQRLQSPSPTSRSSAWVLALVSSLSAASLHSWNVQVKYEGTEIFHGSGGGMCGGGVKRMLTLRSLHRCTQSRPPRTGGPAGLCCSFELDSEVQKTC